MVWEFFSYYVMLRVIRVEGRMDYNKYISMVNKYLFPSLSEYHPSGAIFRQDDALTHISVQKKEF